MTDAERALELLDDFGIIGRIREEMLAEPERALAILERARTGPGIRNPAAYSIARWRAPRAAPPAPEPELAIDPPDLDALEYVWSRPPTVVGELIVKLLAVALERHGGFEALRESFDRHRDPDIVPDNLLGLSEDN